MGQRLRGRSHRRRHDVTRCVRTCGRPQLTASGMLGALALLKSGFPSRATYESIAEGLRGLVGVLADKLKIDARASFMPTHCPLAALFAPSLRHRHSHRHYYHTVSSMDQGRVVHPQSKRSMTISSAASRQFFET